MVGEGDPDCRRCMIWEEAKQNKEISDLYKKLNRIRKENKVLVYGEFECFYADDNVLITRMYDEKNSVITILNNNEDGVEISVQDHGVGISDDIKPLILNERFTTKPSGNGLGLLSCREIIEYFHDGEFGFKSEPNKGSLFYMSIPRIKGLG